MGLNLQAPRGTKDLFGPEYERLEALERLCANTARLWGYSGIRTPIFEETGLFVRSIGEATDIVEKEMFTIPPRADKGDDKSYTLRPENTAGVVRAYLEHNLHKTQGLAKFFYLGPQFRRERPQAGRLREFHQFGVEALGTDSHLADVEVILLAAQVLSSALRGTKTDAQSTPPSFDFVLSLQLRLNNVGCMKPGCRDAYREKLKAELAAQKEKLCGDCQRRLERNIFRVLDCKKENCRGVCASLLAKVPTGFCLDCRNRQAAVMLGLRGMLPEGVELVEDPALVRGLDYYTSTVFEFVVKGIGAQDAVGGGGRYDGLVAEMGGPELGATGFALGLERILLAREQQAKASVKPLELKPPEELCGVLVVPLSDEHWRSVYGLAVGLRRAGFRAELDLRKRSSKALLGSLGGLSQKFDCRFAVIIGQNEVASGKVSLKDMETREQTQVDVSFLAGQLSGDMMIPPTTLIEEIQRRLRS